MANVLEEQRKAGENFEPFSERRVEMARQVWRLEHSQLWSSLSAFSNEFMMTEATTVCEFSEENVDVLKEILEWCERDVIQTEAREGPGALANADLVDGPGGRLSAPNNRPGSGGKGQAANGTTISDKLAPFQKN